MVSYKELNKADKPTFIKITKLIANLGVNAHQNGTIPGGLLMIVDCRIEELNSVLIIKAELQEAMALNGNSVELIKELFLSPAKELFKIGVLIHKKISGKSAAAYESYVYDDHFNPGKDDLAEYFYKDFLGLSTSDNDKLYTNNFLRDFTKFVDNNVGDMQSRQFLKNRIKADYRESVSPIVDPSSYGQFFESDTILTEKFQKLLQKYNRSFSKDLRLVDASLKKSVINITPDLKLVGPAAIVDENTTVLNPNSEEDVRKLTTQIQSGNAFKVVLINHPKSDS